MKTFTLPLEIHQPNSQASAHFYLREKIDPSQKALPTMVICPGGGYNFVSPREAEPIALAFLAQGFNAVVVDYTVMQKSVTGNFLESCLLETAEVFRLIEQNAEDWQMDTKQLFIIGFSAGGHLAAWYANRYTELHTLAPRGCILAYPVISFDYGWPDNENPKHFNFELDKSAYNTAKLVSPLTADTFIWHTANDGAVPVFNSLRYCEALEAAKVPFEAHIFESGPHGLSLSSRSTSTLASHQLADVAGWFDLCMSWIEKKLD